MSGRESIFQKILPAKRSKIWIKMSEIGQKNPKTDILIQRLIQNPLRAGVLETAMYQTIKKDLLKQQNLL